MDGEILRYFIDNQHKSKVAIARDLGITRQALFQYFKSQVISDDVRKRFETYFGQPIFTDEARKRLESNTLEESEPSFLERRRASKVIQTPYLAPFFPVKAQAGYVKAVDQEVYMDTLEKYALPPGISPHGANWRYWEVQGDSMQPNLKSGDIILTSQVHHMDWDHLRNFYVYVIVTKEAVLCKRLYCKNELEWVLISDNEESYPQQLISVDDIREVWVFRRKLDNQIPPPKMFEIKV